MLIGIDGVALQFSGYRAGIYHYTLRILEQLFLQAEDNEYRIYLSGSPGLKRQPVAELFPPHPHVAYCHTPFPQRLLPLADRLHLPVNLFIGGKVDVYFGPGYRIFPRRMYKKSVVTIHDLRFLLQPETFSAPAAVKHYAKITRESLSLADALVAVSQFTADQLIHDCNISEDRVHVIPNGVSEEFFKRADPEAIKRYQKQQRLSDGYVLFVGFLEEKKNLLRLLEAFRICRENKNFHLNLVLAGPQGSYTEKLFDYCRKHALEQTVRFLGEVSAADLPILYQGATIFTFPSLNEGFGIPPLEAMASGTAVVASNTTALPEVLGDAAWYVDPLDPKSIASGIHTLAINNDVRKERAIAGTKHAKGYRWNHAAGKLLQLFHNLT